MDISTMFGLAVATTLLLAWLLGDHVQQKLAILLLFAWASTNLAVNYLGFGRAPLVVPSLDALVAILVALVGYRNRSIVALVVFAGYAIVGVVHVVAFAAHETATYDYYETLNILFALQLMTVGASSAWTSLRTRFPRGHQRSRSHSPRW